MSTWAACQVQYAALLDACKVQDGIYLISSDCEILLREHERIEPVPEVLIFKPL